MDPRGEFLENYRCVDGCQEINISTKAVYVSQLSDALVIQLNIFKYVDVISKKVIPNFDDGISLSENTMLLSGTIYHEGEQSDCGHHTSGVKLENTWFLISDTRAEILKQQKFQCNSRDMSVSCILIYDWRNNFLTASPDSLMVLQESNLHQK